LTDTSRTGSGRATPVPSSADGVRLLPCPFTVRAWWGDELVAESATAVRVEQAGLPPWILLPIEDLRLEAFHLEGGPRSSGAFPVEGGEPWSIEPSGHHRAAAAADWHGRDHADLDGRDVLRTFADAPAAEWLSGLAILDHRRVRLELVDPMGLDDPRSVTAKRFPTWGDA